MIIIRKHKSVQEAALLGFFTYAVYELTNLPLFKNRKDVKDIFGNDGQWQKGDFIIQWPATPLEYRMKVASIYNSLTIV